MKASDLRIGNWVEHDFSWELMVDAVHHDSIYAIDGKTPVHLDLEDCRPIPLTPEWLERFGFEYRGLKMSGMKWFQKDQKGLAFQQLRVAKWHDDEWSFTLECVVPSTLSIAPLKYVHQIQNLYFALTGDELIASKIKNKQDGKA